MLEGESALPVVCSGELSTLSNEEREVVWIDSDEAEAKLWPMELGVDETGPEDSSPELVSTEVISAEVV